MRWPRSMGPRCGTRTWRHCCLRIGGPLSGWKRRGWGWPANAFHVRLAPGLLEELPRDWASVWQKGPPRVNSMRDGDALLGVHPMLGKMAALPTGTGIGLRHCLPARDQRLVRLAAGMPVSLFRHGSLTRPFSAGPC